MRVRNGYSRGRLQEGIEKPDRAKNEFFLERIKLSLDAGSVVDDSVHIRLSRLFLLDSGSAQREISMEGRVL